MSALKITFDGVEHEYEVIDLKGIREVMVPFSGFGITGRIEKGAQPDGRTYGVSDNGDHFSLIIDYSKPTAVK